MVTRCNICEQSPCVCEISEDDYESGPVCTACGGGGLSVEGWDCEECDGEGYLEI